MGREIAVFRTQEGQAEAFVRAYGGVANMLDEAEGSRGAVLHRGVEDPDSFTLIVEWDSVDTHMALKQKPRFESFGEAIGSYHVGQPEVRHVEVVA